MKQYTGQTAISTNILALHTGGEQRSYASPISCSQQLQTKQKEARKEVMLPRTHGLPWKHWLLNEFARER